MTIKLYNHCPSKKSDVILSVPAAFTDVSNKIDGLFISNGMLISNKINSKLNGICVISNNQIQIMYSDPFINDIAKNVIKNSNSLFQQQLLVSNYKIVACTLFKNKLNLRRGLVEINQHFYLIESKSPLTIKDFQYLLVLIKVKNAIYLDMGSFSEGWYRDLSNQIITIGETMTQTNKQSNWLVFKL